MRKRRTGLMMSGLVRRILTMVLMAMLGVGGCSHGGGQFQQESSVPEEEIITVYLGGAAAKEGNDGATEKTAVLQIEDAFDVLDGRGGVIVLCGDVKLKRGYTFPEQKTPVTVSGKAGADSKILVDVGADIYFTTPVSFANVGFQRPMGEGVTEFHAGEHLTFGAGVSMWINDKPYMSGDGFAVYMGGKKQSSSRFTMESGTIGNLHCSSQSMSMETVSVYVGAEAKVLGNVYCGGAPYREVGTVALELSRNKVGGALEFEGGGGHLILTNCGEWVVSDDLEGWQNLTLENTVLEITGNYMGPEAIHADEKSKLQLNALDVAENEVPELIGEGEIGLTEKYYDTYRENLLLTMENVQPEGVARGAYQGMAIYGEYVVQCYNSGYVNIYDLSAEDAGTPIAVFKLASYHDGSEAMRPEGEQWDSEFYRNHCNQVMFGAKKWDESDPFPLLYVTTGKKGWKMEDGSYIAKCAVERIRYDEETGEWSSQLVQIIEYNDCDYVDEGSGRDGMVTLKDGKFTYSDTADWKNTEGYEVPCWGWPAGFVDSCPTEATENKFYLFSARFCTAYSSVGVTSSGNYSHAIKRFNYTDHNNYIITQFALPELPETEAEFGQTVTLTPAEIENQFTTEYDIWGTQGGTMYQGRIYYSYGFGAQPGDELFTRKCNGIRVFDIATEQIVARIDLWKDSEMRTKEPECCAIYQGKLALNYNTGETNLWVFDYIEGLEIKPITKTAGKVPAAVLQ